MMVTASVHNVYILKYGGKVQGNANLLQGNTKCITGESKTIERECKSIAGNAKVHSKYILKTTLKNEMF